MQREHDYSVQKQWAKRQGKEYTYTRLEMSCALAFAPDYYTVHIVLSV